jgi:hypothetical protein
MLKNDSITFRAPTALKRALEAAAEADHRSLAQLCTVVLIQFLEKRGEWPPRKSAAQPTRVRRAGHRSGTSDA